MFINCLLACSVVCHKAGPWLPVSPFHSVFCSPLHFLVFISILKLKFIQSVFISFSLTLLPNQYKIFKILKLSVGTFECMIRYTQSVSSRQHRQCSICIENNTENCVSEKHWYCQSGLFDRWCYISALQSQTACVANGLYIQMKIATKNWSTPTAAMCNCSEM